MTVSIDCGPTIRICRRIKAHQQVHARLRFGTAIAPAYHVLVVAGIAGIAGIIAGIIADNGVALAVAVNGIARIRLSASSLSSGACTRQWRVF